jgi:hypothetical protein
MQTYTLAIVLHVVAVIGVFSAFGVELASLVVLRGALTDDERRRAVGAAHVNRVLGPASLVVLLLTGVYASLQGWGFRPAWIVGSLAALMLVMAIGAAITGVRMIAIERLLEASDSGDVSRRARDPLLPISLLWRAGLVTGAVILMVAQPAMIGTVSVFASVLIVAMLGSVMWRTHS